MKLTKKQKQVYKSFLLENPKILVCSGAKRAGKTFVLIYIFLMHIVKYRNNGLSFIIGGASQASIRRNVLNDMELILGKELKLDKTNAVNIFGNRVYCFDGANADTWKKVRGFTSAGAFLNEGTALHNEFIKEVISRCSYPGARIFIDTNPENPAHSVKTDYIDKDGQRLDNGQLNIRAFHFDLWDNTTLDDEYVQSIIASTPSGMFTDRDIYGRWVSAEGVVYRDFNHDKHYISKTKVNEMQFTEYFAGVDWGYEHYGSIVVIGKSGNNYVLLEEHATQHEEIDYWVDVAKDIISRHGRMVFYCDSARPEHVDRFKREGINAVNANKSIISGIEEVAKLFKQDRLFIVNEPDDKKEKMYQAIRFKEEINMYVWNERTGKPVELFDDVLDALRYAIYSNSQNTGKIRTVNRRKLRL